MRYKNRAQANAPDKIKFLCAVREPLKNIIFLGEKEL
jgi:hypothetical protein